jgi:uncharacterized membrane protein YdbT with pleckstrin-like domain
MSENPQPKPAGELIIYQGKLHWAVFVRPVMVTCLALILFNYGEPLFGAAATIVAGVFWAAALMAAWSSVFVITERRVLIRAGTIYRTDLDLPLERVDGVSVRQDAMGRLLGYGTLVVDGSDGARAICTTVARAAEFGRQLQALRAPA